MAHDSTARDSTARDRAAGRLLVATPAINDGNFDQTAIYMLHHDAVGALGVVLNRPSELPAAEVLPRWSDLLCEPKLLFGGGPVEQHGIIGLAQVRPDAPAELARVPHHDAIATLDLDSDPAISGAWVTRLRLFRGYSGWGPGQLDGEISAGAWFIVDAELDDIFDSTPATLGERIFRRQSGTMRWFANAPNEPNVN